MYCFPIVVVGALTFGLDTPPGMLTSGEYLRSRLPVFVNCMGGPAELPSPPGPETTMDCLIEFDHDEDGDVDLQDNSKALNGPVEPDFWETGDQGGRLNFSLSPLPAGFFDYDGKTCAAFAGEILFNGVPLDPDLVTAADTIVLRAFDPILPAEPIGTERSVPIELVTLSMESIAPITVNCDGQPVEWDVRSEVSTTVIGAMSALKTHNNGGTAEVSLPLLQLLTFTNVADATIERVLDAAAQGQDPVVFTSTLPWSHSADPADPFGPPGFVVGLDTSGGRGAGCAFNFQHIDPADVLPGGETVHSHRVCPADRDDDGITDNVDNCPTVPNTDQADADLDDVGDVCDGGTFSGTRVTHAVPGGCADCSFCNSQCTVCGICGDFPGLCPQFCEQCGHMVELVADIFPAVTPSGFAILAAPSDGDTCNGGISGEIDVLGNIFLSQFGVTFIGFLDHEAFPRTLTGTVTVDEVLLETYTLTETSP